ncbi:uncharacterized protein [Diadema antillarum]|uniref:uncharacterized protein n=1 Tax=Diadema antillarum TaxID=105358 RepID=UPI003A8BF1EF
MSLKLKTLKTLGIPICSDSPDEVFRNNNDAQIDEYLTGLQDAEIQFEEWARVDVDGTKKTKIVQVSLTRAEFISQFRKDVTKFRQHILLIKNQFEALKMCKNTLPSNECIVQMDFAENYSCIPLEEVQSGYWGQQGVTIHPIVVYFRDDDGVLVNKSYVCVSDEKAHNSSTVLAILCQLVPKLKELVAGLTKVHYWTDSPTSQYRNKTIFSVVREHAKLFEGPSAQWNYFEAGHGKGPCDGIGGTVKRLADDAVKRNAANIQDASDFYAWACRERQESTGSKIEYFFVSKSECEESSGLIAERWAAVKSFPGTLQAHEVIGAGDTLLMREQSCYCVKCRVEKADENTKNMCTGWKAFPRIYVPTTVIQAQGTPEDVTPQEPESTTYETDDWVAAVYDERWYIGKVIESDEEDVHISFMAQSSGSHLEDKFKWPQKKDEIWVSRKEVLCHIEEPKRDAISKRLFKLSANQKQTIENVFKAFLSQE